MVAGEARRWGRIPVRVWRGGSWGGTGAGSGAGLGSWMRDVLISVAVSAFIITFLYQPVRVEGTSMLPMLQDEDRLFINKMAYRVGEIHRGDVVVFLYPRDHSKSYIKRVIAVGGDDLRIDRGEVFVNGKALKEPYVPLRFTDDRSQPEMQVPAHEYLRDGGSSLDLERQPGLWAGGGRPDLWQGCVCVLADRTDRGGAVEAGIRE